MVSRSLSVRLILLASFGLVAVEAEACGTPVVAWNNGSVPEVLADGETGFVVDTVEEAVKAVGEVARLSRRACRRAFEQRFDATRMAQNYVEVYSRLIETAGWHRSGLIRPDSGESDVTVWPTLAHIS